MKRASGKKKSEEDKREDKEEPTRKADNVSDKKIDVKWVGSSDPTHHCRKVLQIYSI